MIKKNEDLSHKLWPTRVRVMNYQKYDQGSLVQAGLIRMAFIQIMIYAEVRDLSLSVSIGGTTNDGLSRCGCRLWMV